MASIKNNYLKQTAGDPIELYLNPNKPGGPIWNMFFLHCLENKKWPIFDQHTYRAMIFIKKGLIEELSTDKKEIYSCYQEEYIPFFKSLKCDENRKKDRALFTFGQFLKKIKPYYPD